MALITFRYQKKPRTEHFRPISKYCASSDFQSIPQEIREHIGKQIIAQDEYKRVPPGLPLQDVYEHYERSARVTRLHIDLLAYSVLFIDRGANSHGRGEDIINETRKEAPNSIIFFRADGGRYMRDETIIGFPENFDPSKIKITLKKFDLV